MGEATGEGQAGIGQPKPHDSSQILPKESGQEKKGSFFIAHTFEIVYHVCRVGLYRLYMAFFYASPQQEKTIREGKRLLHIYF